MTFAALVPIELEDMVLARAPEYLADMAAAEEDLAAGRDRPAAQEAGAQALLSEEQARELAASELQAMRRERRTRP